MKNKKMSAASNKQHSSRPSRERLEKSSESKLSPTSSFATENKEPKSSISQSRDSVKSKNNNR